MVDSLHGMDMRLMLSVWSKIDKNSPVGKEADAKGYYIPGSDWIDFFNPEASQFYWNNFSKRLLMPYEIDAWWQDATEPENDDLEGRRVMNGRYRGELFRNVYPLLVNRTVYEGCRTDMPQKAYNDTHPLQDFPAYSVTEPQCGPAMWATTGKHSAGRLQADSQWRLRECPGGPTMQADSSVPRPVHQRRLHTAHDTLDPGRNVHATDARTRIHERNRTVALRSRSRTHNRQCHQVALQAAALHLLVVTQGVSSVKATMMRPLVFLTTPTTRMHLP